MAVSTPFEMQQQVARLLRELQIVTEQLRDEKSETNFLRGELRDVAEERDRLYEALQCLAREEEAQQAASGQQRLDVSSSGAVHSSVAPPSCSSYRYVPPHTFLPRLFLEQYVDVLEIVDKYAFLYYRHYASPEERLKAFNCDTNCDTVEAAYTSRIQLLEERCAQLEKTLAEKTETIHSLKKQLRSPKRGGRETSKSAVENDEIRGAIVPPSVAQRYIDARRGRHLVAQPWAAIWASNRRSTSPRSRSHSQRSSPNQDALPEGAGGGASADVSDVEARVRNAVPREVSALAPTVIPV